MEEKTISWQGASGTLYKYWILDMSASFKKIPGNYIFAKEVSPGKWLPIYIGESENLADRLTDSHEKLPCIKRNGGTHIHAHGGSTDAEVRQVEESDLIEKWNTLCNKE